ncbi:hypothetical protein [Aquimarina sp. I32.4]|uniref:hypothetical protein n=1 Tax=Aquimarina sp. I32.4 TaxID=2053903 RepID=UPI0011AEC81F|nr:hypothetical protein [Aquimarina sp. I32.4]
MKPLSSILTLLLIILLNTSCSDDSYLNIEKKSSAPTLTGEEIFKGIFFLEGDISKNIDHLKPLKEIYDKQLKTVKDYDDHISKISDVEKNIINYMKIIEPNFFIQFREAITSNDPSIAETAIRRASSLFIKALYSDIELKPYLINSEFLLKNLDESKVTNKNNGIDPLKLESELNSIISQYTNSKNTLSNFGIKSNNNQITMCATVVIVAVAAAVAAITVVAASAYAVALNVAAALNAVVAVNLKVTINHDNGDGGGNGGGGGSCYSCHANASRIGMSSDKKNRIKTIEEIAFKPIPFNCGGKIKNNIETEIFLRDVTTYLNKISYEVK